MDIHFVSKTLHTERLTLRAFHSDDAQGISQLLKDRDVASTTLMLPSPCSIQDATNLITRYRCEEKQKKVLRWAITSLSNHNLLGGIRLEPNMSFNSAEIGFWIGKPHWRKGFTFEAANRILEFGFKDLHINRIEAHSMAENQSSVHLLKKLGFQQEGYHPQLVRKWGEYKDVITFGLLRKQYIH